ncbi:hemerythrin domain-containing protein [Brevundimonas sp.]|uniref:hemerythrin domain-containing protein n=1 Tax=Brevundimonas sp. TaxID=1871086 RepID=UPI00121C6010|nr:hemerythrin domain-containing protein [Brevundimonas sp.]TAJ67477.1 MAG: hemerythrin domain-containing protein [Brevundimonas sp.]
MNISALRLEHSAIMAQASRLVGVAGAVKTRGDAHDAVALIQSLDVLLRNHLAEEDDHLYPALMAAGDEDTRRLGADAFEAMGGIVGAWANYRDHWTLEAILGEAGRFGAATEGVIGALALRIEMENGILYPAMERLTGGSERAAA